MKNLFHRKSLAYLALLFWLFASSSGMHGHSCFDGMEAPVSVHFDLFDKHADELEQQGHKDLDSQPAQLDLLKMPKLDMAILISLLLLVVLWPPIRGRYYQFFNTPLAWLNVADLRPPQRAPPHLLH